MKAQSAVESAMMITFMTLVFMAFLLIVSDRYVDIQEQKDRQLIKDVGAVIQNEVDLALIAEDGYFRSFNLPAHLRDRQYLASLSTAQELGANFSELSIKYVGHTKEFEHVLTLPMNIDGTLYEGSNFISKINGTIYINVWLGGSGLPPGCTDSDSDGFAAEGGYCGSKDCDDGNPDINPGADEICDNGVDDDCDGDEDVSDPDCGCVETDGGINYYLNGTTVNATKTETDYCTDDVLTEFYCDGCGVKEIEYTCSAPFSCADGACVSEALAFVAENNVGERVASFSPTGYITLKGNCVEGGDCSSPLDDVFIIEDDVSGVVAYIDDAGNLCIEGGDCLGGDADCDSAGDGSFVVKDNNDVVVSYIDITGNLCLLGELIQNGDP